MQREKVKVELGGDLGEQNAPVGDAHGKGRSDMRRPLPFGQVLEANLRMSCPGAAGAI